MKIKKVRVHKMNGHFKKFPIIQYSGQFNNDNLLVNLFNNLNQPLTLIKGTLQWKLEMTNDVYFIEQDYEYFH